MIINAAPTPYAELNGVLAELTRRAARVLGDNFVGAYLQGSFAIGDADLHSDCDFLIPVHAAITAEQEAGLRALHNELPRRSGHWTCHLEGSYPVADELYTLDSLGRPWLYVDHGAREMEWSTHCNSEVVRWSLRERGVVLAGPDPKTLVAPVSPDALRARMVSSARTVLTDLDSWTSLEIAWSQRYAVAMLCRILYTYAEGEVCSKRQALLWAEDHVDPEWTELLRRAREDRSLGLDLTRPAEPGAIAQTVAFVGYVQRRVNVHSGY